MSSESGIYQIKNLHNGKLYIGSAVNIAKRWATHVNDLRAGKHRNQILQRAWNKYGADAFAFSVIETVSNRSELIAREQHWIDELLAIRDGYNIAPTAGSQLGYRHTDDAKQRMSLSQTGKKRSAEAIEKTASALRGKPKSPEHARKVGLAHKGKVMSADSRLRMSETRKGVKRGPMSDECKAKIAAALKGKKRSNTGWTDERKAAMSQMMRGRAMPADAVARTRQAMLGRVFSDETRARMSEAGKRRAARLMDAKGPQVATPPTEPPGRADDGQAYQE